MYLLILTCNIIGEMGVGEMGVGKMRVGEMSPIPKVQAHLDTLYHTNQRVVTYVPLVDAFATGIKMESSDPGLYWRRSSDQGLFRRRSSDQDILRVTVYQRSNTFLSK